MRRKQQNAERQRQRRFAMSPEEREKENERRQRRRRSNLTQEELDNDAERQRQRRSNMSQEEHVNQLHQRRLQQSDRWWSQSSQEVNEEEMQQLEWAQLSDQERALEDSLIISQDTMAGEEARTEDVFHARIFQLNGSDEGEQFNAVPTAVISIQAFAAGRYEALCSIDAFSEQGRPPSFVGTMNGVCLHCGARFYPGEKLISKNQYTTCCMGGVVDIPHMQRPPPLLEELLIGHTTRAKCFIKKARRFNTTLSCASITMNETTDFPGARGVPALLIQGSVYHNLGDVLPNAGEQPRSMQVFFHESGYEANANDFAAAEQELLHAMISEMKITSPLLTSIRTILDNPLYQSIPTLKLIISDSAVPAGSHSRTYNAPSCTEISAIIIGGESYALSERRTITITKNSGGVQRVKSNHSSYDPLSYGITHSHAEKGWTFDILRRLSRKHLTAMDFYCFRLQVRDAPWQKNDISTYRINRDVVTFGGLLFQQYICDQYAKIEEQRLDFLRFNQPKLKAELYKGLVDAVAANDSRAAGKFVVLPATFIGSPRHNYASFQDAMAIARKHGKPDLFITMTCNPKWEEILSALRPTEQAWMRPDITTRVFKLKFNELMDDLLKRDVLGRVIAHVQVIEFQKRGLPHAHILLFLHPDDKPRTVDSFDRFVCAEIPDPIRNKPLYDIVTRNMMHGPCGVLNPNCSCMKQGVCTKQYPKRLVTTTEATEDGYPQYRRRGRYTYEKNGIQMDDGWVVPYNPQLLFKYNCHINVEIVNSIHALKYLFKYVYKGHDRAVVQLRQDDQQSQVRVAAVANGTISAPLEIDEINKFVDSRYVSATESMWRILGFSMATHYPPIFRLQIHLPQMQMLMYEEGKEQEALQEAAHTDTMLTNYFKTVDAEIRTPLPAQQLMHNGSVLPKAPELSYAQFPTFYTWQTEENSWRRRIRPKQSDAIGRICTVSPKSGELFYLRMLLFKVTGCCSFEDVRTVNTVLYPSFKAACAARGYLADDQEWRECLTEGAHTMMPPQLRELFAIILFHNNPSDALALWNLTVADTFHNGAPRCLKHEMSNDFYLQRLREDDVTAVDNSINDCLLLLQQKIHDLSNGSITDLADYGLPTPVVAIAPVQQNQLIAHELYENDRGRFELLFQTNYALFNPEQKRAFDAIDRQLLQPQIPNFLNQNLFFLDAPGGTGKTFVLNTLLAKHRAQGRICLATASSGIAAILLEGGVTAHSRFKIPLQPDTNTSINVTQRSDLGKLLMRASIIVWDEAPMISRLAVAAVDKLMRDLKSCNDIPFGGTTVVFSGDFRQVLPVVKREGRAGITSMIIKKLGWWRNVQTLPLLTNMRIRSNANTPEDAADFENFLLSIGNGTVPAVRELSRPETPNDMIQVPDRYLFHPQPSLLPDSDSAQLQFIKWVYPELRESTFNFDQLSKKAILCSTNDEVDMMNQTACKLLPGNLHELYSADSVFVQESDEEANTYPIEFLNSVCLPGMPPHQLSLKVGSPVILLRNLNPKAGLCNGTRMQILEIGHRVLKVRLSNGSHSGETCYIPRIDLITSDDSLPCHLKRRQFPVKLAFAMTINKAQGQSLEKVGIFLPKPVFSHGQLYVALSRSGCAAATKLFIPADSENHGRFAAHEGVYTRNVVFQEVFT